MRLPTTPVTAALRGLRDEARQHYRAGRVVIAVDAPRGAGAAAFADALAEVYAEDGAAVYRAGLDGFQRPRAERDARGAGTPEALYRDTFDLATFRRVLIDPFRLAGGTGFQLTAFDRDRDAPAEAQWVTAPRDAVLVVDGAFLLRPELRGLWNWSVRLEAGPARSADDGAEALYRRETDPRAAASALVDNSDPARPVRVFGDFC